MSLCRLVEVYRGEKLESEHYGVAVLYGRKRLIQAWGDPNRYVYTRSLIKPIQAKVSLDFISSSGGMLTEEQVAIACSSHYAEPEQLDVVDQILRSFDLKQEDIKCGYEHNCSGKHSAILAAAKTKGLSLEYLNPQHPYQVALKSELIRLGLEQNTYSFSDGCGLQTFHLSITRLAAIFAAMVEDKAYTNIIATMNKHPLLIGGKSQFDSLLMENYPNKFIAKTGAEGMIMVANLQTNEVLVLKLIDGARRAKAFAIASLMKQLGWIDEKYNAGTGELITNAQDQVVGSLKSCLCG